MRRRGFWVVLMFHASFYLLVTDGHFFSTDEIHVYQTTRSILTRNDLSIDPINNAVPGRYGRFYSHTGIAPAIASVPFFVVGMALEQYLPDSSQKLFAGEKLGSNGEWGGDIKIFVVNLFNVPLTALLCGLFYLCSLELGFSFRCALVLTFILGLSTIVCVYAQTYFHHTLVATCLIGALYALLVNKRVNENRLIRLAGLIFGIGILTRGVVILAMPLFLLFVAVSASNGTFKQQVARLGNFFMPAALCAVVYVFVNWLKFGSLLQFGYPVDAFGGSLLVGAFGHLFSLGRSVFIYSPPLILSTLCWRRFYMRNKWEMIFFGALGILYLVIYSKFIVWHGAWGWGNRYLLPVVPFLLFPLGILIEQSLVDRQKAIKWLVLAFALSGFFVQILGLTPYISFVYWDWTLAGLKPAESYLYVPEISPLAVHWRLLLSGSNIDFWIYHVYREQGAGVAAFFATFPLAIMVLAAGQALRLFRLADEDHPNLSEPARSRPA